MKIAIDARIISLSTGRYVERLLHHLQQIDSENEYTVLLLARDFENWEPMAPNFSKQIANFPIYSAGEQAGLAKLLNQLNVDLVHFTMANHSVMYRRPHVVTVHDLTLVDFVNKRDERGVKHLAKNVAKPLAFKGVMWWAATKSDAVITPTRFVRDQLVKRFRAPKNRVFVTYEAADPLAVEAKKGDYGQGDEFVMYVGNAYPYKNLWLLIQAFHQLNRPGLKLVLVGKKEFFYDELEKRTEEAGIKNVIFAGYVPDAELAWLYQHAKLYVFPSLSEGFGLPPLEAMTYGLPVLSSNASCLPEVYGPAVQYFDPHSTENLAQNMGALLDDGKRREALSKAGSERVKQFSWRRMAEETLEVYKKAIKG
jgi:glycosyltransferase involved in cell wall biosynthesis